MKQKILQVLIVIMLIMTMTMANVLLICSDVVSYALDLTELNGNTNHKNVEFIAYFKDEQGNKTNETNTLISNNDLRMYLQVSVKREGYFNGSILLSDSNFKIKPEILSEGIDKIDGNVIYLNQINMGETREIEVAIETIKEERFDLASINKETTLEISGIYKDSSQKDISISATKNITLNIVNPYSNSDENVLLEQEVITNKLVKYNGEDKRVIQIKLNSELKDNLFPVKEKLINIQIPKISDKEPEQVLVNSNTLLVSNGKMLSQDDWSYDKDNQKININIKNEIQDNKISWIKSGNDEIIVTFIFDKDVEINSEVVDVESKIEFYNNKELEKVNKLILTNEEKDAIVSTKIEKEETNVYKGKIYAGLSRDVVTKDIIDINLDKSINEVNVNEINNGLTLKYKETRLIKEEINKVLGNQGKLIIIDQATGREIETISSNTVADENGNIVINYPEEIRNITFEIVNPEKIGRIEIENVKTIIENRVNVIKNTNQLQTILSGNYSSSDSRKNIETKEVYVDLVEPQTSVDLQISRTELSAMTQNNNVEFRVVLNSKNESNTLFNNPTIRLELPEKFENIEINSINLLYEDELKITSATLEGKVINIQLSGTQTKYKEEAIDGAIIIINTNLKTNKKIPSSIEQVILSYKNNNAIGELNEERISKDINIVSYAGIVTTTQVEGYGIDIINNEGNKLGNLKISSSAESIEVKNEIINNVGNAVSGVQILGILPTKDAIKDVNNIETVINDNIQIQGIDLERVKVYYSNNNDATADVNESENAWSEEIDKVNAKKYLILIDKLDSYEEVHFAYGLSVPEGLEYNAVTELGYEVYYTNIETNIESLIELDNIRLETGKGPVVDTELKLYKSAEINSVREGEILTYEMTVTNTGSEETQNIKVVGKVPENTVYVENTEISNNVSDEVDNFEPFTEYPEKQEVEFDINQLLVGESVTKAYRVIVDKNTAGEQITNVALTTYGEVSKPSNEITNNIENSDLRLQFYSSEAEEGILHNGFSSKYILKVKNTSDRTKTNLKLQLSDSDLVTVKEIFYVRDEKSFTEKNKNTIKIEKIDPDEEIDVAIVIKPNVIKGTEKQTDMLSVKVEDGNAIYNSNAEQITIMPVNLDISMSSENNDSYVKEGDTIEYIINVKNNGIEELGQIKIENTLSRLVTLVEISEAGRVLGEQEYNETSKQSGEKIIKINTNLAVGEEKQYTIKAVVNKIPGNKSSIEILDSIKVYSNGIEMQSEQLKHILSPIIEDEEQNVVDNTNNTNNAEGTNSENNTNNTNNPNNMNRQNTKSISGTVWVDSNENGSKDPSEELLSGIEVKLLNTKTNEFVKDDNNNILVVKTNKNGFYSFDAIKKGEYIVIFEYDTNKYVLTEYEKSGISEKNASKAINRNMNVNDNVITVAATEVIKVDEENISNINVGLQVAKTFDLKIDKYISKVVVQNSKGTENYEYDEKVFAKAEIDAKQLNGTTVVVEYTIKVTNNGDVDAYAKKITDYIAKDYKFNSELNKDWYQSGQNLCNTSLSNEAIKPGESKELKLIVIKQMTENNTGLINNTAEISEQYNEYGLKDNTENKASADLILSIKTGQVATAITLIFVVIIIIGGITYILSKYVFKRLI